MKKVVTVRHILDNLAELEMGLNDGLMALKRCDSFATGERDHELAVMILPMYEVTGLLGDASLMIPATVCGTTPVLEAKPFVLDYYIRAYKSLATYIGALQTLADTPFFEDAKETLLEQIEITNNYKAEMAETWELDETDGETRNV